MSEGDIVDKLYNELKNLRSDFGDVALKMGYFTGTLFHLLKLIVNAIADLYIKIDALKEEMGGDL